MKDPETAGTAQSGLPRRDMSPVSAGLRLLSIGPLLILIILVVVVRRGDAEFPQTRQYRQHPRPDGGDRRRRDGPAPRHPDPRHRPVGRLQPGARDGGRRAGVPGYRQPPHRRAGDADLGRPRRRRQRLGLCVRTAAPSVHHHAGNPEHLPRPRARTRPQSHHDARHAGPDPAGRRRIVI